MGQYTCTLTVHKTGYYARWGGQEEDCAMSIDCGEEEWRRLHDIRLNGQVGHGSTHVHRLYTKPVIMTGAGVRGPGQVLDRRGPGPGQDAPHHQDPLLRDRDRGPGEQLLHRHRPGQEGLPQEQTSGLEQG